MLRKTLEKLRSRQAPRLAPREAYDRWAATYSGAPNTFQNLEAEAREEVLPPLDGRQILDVGCGTGRTADAARTRGAARVVATDLSPSMVAAAPQLDKLVADVRRLPIRPESFDVVICALVLGHVAELEDALQSLSRTLRPGGHLVVSGFHPAATLRGWRRTFEDERGKRFEIEHHLHLFSDYVGAFGRLGLVLEDLREPLWQDCPVVFALRARLR